MRIHPARVFSGHTHIHFENTDPARTEGKTCNETKNRGIHI